MANNAHVYKHIMIVYYRIETSAFYGPYDMANI